MIFASKNIKHFVQSYKSNYLKKGSFSGSKLLIYLYVFIRYSQRIIMKLRGTI